MNNNGYKKLCSVSDLKENSGRRFIIDNTDIALFKIDGEIYAVSNICSHQHTALIYTGFVEDKCVVCPAHGWKFDLKTGNLPKGRRGINTFETKVENDTVYVLIENGNMAW